MRVPATCSHATLFRARGVLHFGEFAAHATLCPAVDAHDGGLGRGGQAGGGESTSCRTARDVGLAADRSRAGPLYCVYTRRIER